MPSAFKPCPDCSRHVKLQDAQCPHCQADLSSTGARQSHSTYARLLGVCVAAGVSASTMGCAYGTAPVPDTEPTGTSSETQSTSSASGQESQSDTTSSDTSSASNASSSGTQSSASTTSSSK